MSLKAIKIEHPSWAKGKPRHKGHKEYKKMRNRKIRRTPKDQVPNIKRYTDYEY